MSVSAAELPAMSSALGTNEEIAATLRKRLAAGLQQIAYFVVPSAVAFVLLGDVVVATIYRSGAFKATDVTYVWAVIAGSAVGLLASTSGRLYSSAFYALRDTRTPLNFAVVRVVLTLILGYFFALPLPRFSGSRPLGRSRPYALRWPRRMGGVHAASPRSASRDRCGRLLHATRAEIVAGGDRGSGDRLWDQACPAISSPLLVGPAVLIPYGAIYLALTQVMGISTVGGLMRRFTRR